MVKVLPVPVAPSNTWFCSPEPIPSASSAIAFGWSPEGRNSVCMIRRLPPSSFSLRAGSSLSGDMVWVISVLSTVSMWRIARGLQG